MEFSAEFYDFLKQVSLSIGACGHHKKMVGF